MKFVATKEALLEGLQRIQNVVSSRATLPILSNVLIETAEDGLLLTTTDMDLSIRSRIAAEVEMPGATTLPAKKLLLIVKELPAPEVIVESDARNATSLRCGPSYFKIYGLGREEFPEFPHLPNAYEFRMPQAELKDGLRKTSYATSVDDHRYVLNGLLLSFRDGKLTLVATDGRRLALAEIEMEFPAGQETDVILPIRSVNELQKLIGESGDVVIRVAGNLISFEMNGSLLVSKRVDGNYPNYKQVIPGEPRQRVRLEREAFLNAVHRVALLSSEKSSTIKLTFSENQVQIAANAPEIGEAEETMAVPYNGPEFAIAFNPQYLMDPLRNVSDPEIFLDLIDEISPGVIKTHSPFLYVLMPLRVATQT